METSRRVSGYDVFKLIVAIVLLILYLILRRGTTPQTSIPNTLVAPATMALAPAQTSLAPASQTSPLVTATPIPTSTETPLPKSTPTILPSPTQTSTVELTGTPSAEAAIPSACEAAGSRSHLQVGTTAIILRRLNLRSSPGIRDNWILTNRSGTQVKVIGGPECFPYWTGAYVWWQIKLQDGRVGWSAEGSLHGAYYFIEPIP